jgi:membrane fusion protein (multidrug efflux system)
MSDNQPRTAGTPGATRGNGRRRILLLLVLLVLIAAGVAYAVYYLTYARYHEDTDDAYVNGHVVQITPQLTGTVTAVNADDTEFVHAGDPLVALDPADARVALGGAEANLAQAVRQVRTVFVNDNAYQAEVTLRSANLARAQDDLRRRESVAQSGAVSTEEIAHARDTVKTAQAALLAAREQLASNQSLTANTTIAEHPNVKAAAARVRDAYLGYARTMLPAPVTGYVARRSVQVGQRVAPGNPLMAVVPLAGVWVDANFKEVQLRHVRVGQAVELTADVYGSAVVYHGHVQGFSAGTGSAFALLPAQNATGNWIKVVQRLPVRVALDPSELQQHPLRIGLSMQVDVNTHDETGGQLNTAAPTSYRTAVFDKYGDEADAEIARIIAQNAGVRAAGAQVAPGAPARS